MTVMEPEVLSVDTDAGDHDRYAHIVLAPNAPALILQARIEGTRVKAICGKVWIPSRDPERYRTCPTCRERYAMWRGGNGPDPQ